MNQMLYAVTRLAAGQDPDLMPPGWEGRWHEIHPYGAWNGGEIYCYGNGTDQPATAVFQLMDRTEERSDGEIANVWELRAL